MPQTVRMQTPIRRQAHAYAEPVQNGDETSIGKRPSVALAKKPRLRSGLRVHGQPRLQSARGGSTDKHNAIPGPLAAPDEHGPVSGPPVLDQQMKCLARAQASVCHHEDRGVIAYPGW